jgi:hypothetical protein
VAAEFGRRREGALVQMSFECVIAGVLFVGGAVTVWAGPDLGVREDGTPFPLSERWWVRAFGVGLMACGAIVLAATLLGFRGQPLNELPAP